MGSIAGKLLAARRDLDPVVCGGLGEVKDLAAIGEE